MTRLPDAMRVGNSIGQRAAAVATSVALSTLLAVSPPAHAKVTLEAAVAEQVEASYPFLAAQKAETFAPFEEKLIGTLLSAKPEELGKTIDAGIDVFLSLPSDKVAALTAVLKEASASATAGGCTNQVPSPVPKSIVSKFASSDAVKAADPAKVQAFVNAAGPALKALPTGDTICLPPVPVLTKLAMVQIDVGTSADPDLIKEFDKLSKKAGKSIPTSKLAGILPDAKKLPGIRTAATGEELSQQKRLRAASTVLEKAVAQAAKDAM